MTASNQTELSRSMVLTREEMNLLRFTCEIHTGEGSPLGHLTSVGETNNFGAVADDLVKRGLAEAKTLRPDRELLRRLLITSQPESRIVLMRSQQQSHETLFEAYERAGVFMPFIRAQDRYTLCEPILESSIFDKLAARFNPRGARGDLINLSFSLSEYFVFSALAGDLKKRRRTQSKRVIANPSPNSAQRSISHVRGRGPSVLISSTVDDEGTPIRGMLRDLPPELGSHTCIPTPDRWEAALDKLVQDDVVTEKNDRHSLRPYLHDLADGLCSQRRFVLTRFDFGAEDWFVQDVSFVDVPGSLFRVQANSEQQINITELNDSSFSAEVWKILSPTTSQGHAKR